MARAGEELEHLTGLRSFLALWIVCGHYMPGASADGSHRSANVSAITCRSFAAVDLFIVMSGYVTHLAYGNRLRSESLSLRRYYLLRMAHILITSYVAMLWSLLVVLAVEEYRDSFLPSISTLLGCFGFVQHWIRPATWCPAPPSWTIEALLPSWLLYPFLRILVARLEGRPGALVMWMLVVYAISFGPLLSLYLLQDGHLNWGQFATTFMWPPAQLPDFALGVLASELSAALPSCSGCSGWCRAMLGDAALLGFAAAVVMLPSPSTHAECQTDSNVLLTHGGSLAIALFIFGSASGSCLAYVLRHPALVSLGKYSFEVYLFQWPLQALFRRLCRFPTPETFMAFLLLLWLLSGLYVEFIAAPLTRCLRSVNTQREKL
ncbi:Hypothetical protein SCF082_LOCUS29287 [Durusdinium trenchii]|uniref:Acyltransferase 3 domain-containing protein n=1 Tax=Durusdinium trenchii TaxID=1381693 RepID=A0ABP0MQV4_9DINO